jgi:hypothetical protein
MFSIRYFNYHFISFTYYPFTEIGKRLLGVPIFMPSSIRDETVIHRYKHYFLKVHSE